MTEPDVPTSADVPAQMYLPYPPPARPRRRTGLLIAGVVALVLAVAGGVTALVLLNPGPASHATTAPTPTTTGATSPSPTPSPSASEAAPYLGRLQSLVVPMPAGATHRPLKMGDADGSLTLDQYLEEYFDLDARARAKTYLTGLEFQRGVFISWFDHQAIVQIQIVQFRHTAGATTFQNDARENDTADPDTIEIAGIAEIEGSVLIRGKDVRGGPVMHAEFSKDALAVEIDIFNPPGGTTASTKALAIEQYRRLP